MDKNMSYGHPPPPGFAPQPGVHPQPPPPYYPGQPANVVVLGAHQFGPESQHMTCPFCHNNVSTTVETEANTKTHLFAALFCFTGLWCCVPCPYCIDTCMVKRHYCPSCGNFLGQSDN